jgi:hypothetical protein
MPFDAQNPVIKLCALAIEKEGSAEAAPLALRAWTEATNDWERCIAAHYVARHQSNVMEKLIWDERALLLAQNLDEVAAASLLPSLYLNVGRCYEDLNDRQKAQHNYRMAHTYAGNLNNDGYGNMVRKAIDRGLERVQ